ncbi:hypothetical protein FOZ62_023980 [Perkinsus olseni]|uniref:Uncharacterized protein n=3 Tax=Perkinsus olseni TaxID=32597 RepID=A0A7J6N3Y5_PEROL|nr:hypothetical protein FOZ62_023980 [Perkinsus olseni]
MALLSTALLLTTGLGRTPDEYWGKVHVQSYPENWRQPEVPADHRAEGAEDNNPIDQPIHEACRAGDLERIKLLVKAGARIDAPGRDFESCVFRAAGQGQMETLEWLMRRGANATTRSRSGYSALDAAARNGHFQVVSFLITQADFDPNQLHDIDGYSSLHRACWGKTDNHQLTVRTMVKDYGGDPLAPSGNGYHCYQMTPNKKTRKVPGDRTHLPALRCKQMLHKIDCSAPNVLFVCVCSKANADSTASLNYHFRCTFLREISSATKQG